MLVRVDDRRQRLRVRVARLVDHLARDTEVGGGLARRVLRAMTDVVHPRGAGVVIETAQGSVTTAFFGLIRDDPATRSEFLQLVRGLHLTAWR